MRLEAQTGRMKVEEPNSLLPALADLYKTNKAQVDDFIAEHFGQDPSPDALRERRARQWLYRRV